MGSARGAAGAPGLSRPTQPGPTRNKVRDTRDVGAFPGRITAAAAGSVPADWGAPGDRAGALRARLHARLHARLPDSSSGVGKAAEDGWCPCQGQPGCSDPGAAAERRCGRWAGAQSCSPPSGGAVPCRRRRRSAPDNQMGSFTRRFMYHTLYTASQYQILFFLFVLFESPCVRETIF